uniref:Uncharacterized protein n=1 Tax=Rhizophora mucronata TaxID=61149 RepID=A0A2P2Q4I9_RHIMU
MFQQFAKKNQYQQVKTAVNICIYIFWAYSEGQGLKRKQERYKTATRGLVSCQRSR